MARIQKEGNIMMSTFSQQLADSWTSESPAIAYVCFSGCTEFTGKVSASESLCPASVGASKGGPAPPRLPG